MVKIRFIKRVFCGIIALIYIVLSMFQEFKNKFNLPSGDFLAPIDFIDGNFGFSTLKKYPNNYVSLFKIFISKEELEKNNLLKPIYISASYGKETSDGITLSSSSEKIKGIFDPIDLRSNDDFFYNINTKEFFYKNKRVEAEDILKKIDELHRKPTKPIKGFWLKIKLLFWRIILIFLIEKFSNIVVSFLYLSSGAKISKNIWIRRTSRNQVEEEMDATQRKVAEGRTIDFFGYKANPWAVIFYCDLHIIFYLIFSFFSFYPIFLATIFKNTFLTIVYVISSLSFIEIIFPKILEFLVKKADLIYENILSREIKI